MCYDNKDSNDSYTNKCFNICEKTTQTYGICEPLFHKFYICSTLANQEDQYFQPEPSIKSLSALAIKSRELFRLLQMADN